MKGKVKLTPFKKWCLRVKAIFQRKFYGKPISYSHCLGVHPGWEGWNRRTVYVHPVPGDNYDPYIAEVKLSFWDNLPPQL